MTYLLTLLSWVPIEAAGMTRDWCRVGAKACRWVCWCIWKRRRSRQGTYEVDCWHRRRARCAFSSAGRMDLMEQLCPVWHGEPCWLNSVFQSYSFQFFRNVSWSLCVYVSYLFTFGYSMLRLYDFSTKALGRHLLSKIKWKFKYVMILRLSLELHRTFQPLISKTDLFMHQTSQKVFLKCHAKWKKYAARNSNKM